MDESTYYKDAIRFTAKSGATAGLVMVAFLMLGAPLWKAGAAFVVIFGAHRAGIARQYTEFFAVAAIAVALVVWAEVLPSRATFTANMPFTR